jgi:hypothetical protein
LLGWSGAAASPSATDGASVSTSPLPFSRTLSSALGRSAVSPPDL